MENGVATFGGARAVHVLKVLHGEVGQTIRTGEVGGRVGTSEIVEIRNDGTIVAKVRHDGESARPWIDLILAPPRPRVMKRLLPQLASMGVGSIVLVGAKKVEKDFWGATLLKEEIYRPLLLDGLMQSGASVLPKIAVRRNFRRFMADELDAMFQSRVRIVAHPYGEPSCPAVRSSGEQPVLAVGPEGGWTDDEVASFEERGFARYSLGPRILRTDTACVALIAQLMKEFGT